MAKLILHQGKTISDLKLEKHARIGRHPASDIILEDPMTSGNHAYLVEEGNQWILRDLNSSNGTFVNRIRVKTAELKEGDQIQIGPAILIFSDEAVRSISQMQVTIGDSGEAIIHARIDGNEDVTFLSADKITDIEQLKQDYEKLRVANELNQAIGLETDISVLLSRILDELFNLLPADRGVILLMNPSTGKLEPRATKQRADSKEEIKLSNTVISEVFGSGKAVLTSDASLDSRFSSAKSVMATGMRSTMCVPMIYRKQLYGIVHLDTLYARGIFSNKDLQILTGLAAQAGRAIDNAYKAKEIERSALARRDFERLLPPEIVEQVLSGKVQLQRGGELRETAVLFSDIRGFTRWTEKHKPAHIVSILNDYFELMVDAIHRHHGTLDKFMGDGIMALFGAPISHENDTLNAVHCAMDMMRGLESLNIRLRDQGEDDVEIGIGINNGPVIAGYMGSSKSMEYTAIGDHVNLSARLCGVAAPGQILLSDNTFAQVNHVISTNQLEPVMVKGKEKPVDIYEVIGRLQSSTGPVISDFRDDEYTQTADIRSTTKIKS